MGLGVRIRLFSPLSPLYNNYSQPEIRTYSTKAGHNDSLESVMCRPNRSIIIIKINHKKILL